MALKLKCPCGERLTAPESAAGKRGKCSKCGRKFIIPDPQRVAEPMTTPGAADDLGRGLPSQHDGPRISDSEFGQVLDGVLNEPNPVVAPIASLSTQSGATPPHDEVAPAGRRSGLGDNDLGSLSHVHRGLTFVYFGVCCIVIGFLAIPLAYVANWTRFWDLANALIYFVVPMLINAGILIGFVGRVMCLSVPKEFKSTWAIYAAVACDVGTMLASVGYHTGMLPGLFRLLGPIGFFLFVFFLKRLACYIRDDVSEKRADTTLKLFTVLGILAVVVVAGVFLLPEKNDTFELLGMTFAVAIGVMGFVTLISIAILYVMLLVSLRRSLSVAELVGGAGTAASV